jgi:hypothetical protein
MISVLSMIEVEVNNGNERLSLSEVRFNRNNRYHPPPYIQHSLSTLHHTPSLSQMSSLTSIEAPVIPVVVGKEAVETTSKAVEVKVGETLTEEMLYPDRAILTSTCTTCQHH